MKQHVVVLSSRGFIGSTLSNKLEMNPDITLTKLYSETCNLLDPIQTAKVIGVLPEPFTFVLLSTFGRSPVDNFHVYNRNVMMATHLTAALAQKKVHHVIFTSSACVYGRPPTTLPITENNCIEISGHYGLSKYVSEKILQLNLHCPITIIRIPGSYGELDKKQSIVSSFIDRIKKGIAIQLEEKGTQIRDFIYGEDVANVIAHFIREPYNGVINVASGDQISMLELANYIGEKLNILPKIEFTTSSMPQFDLYFDLSKMKTTLPRHQYTGIQDGVLRLI